MPRRALVVDDDPLVLEVITSMLKELGCETLTARSGTDALGRLANDDSIELLFADINMPGLSGPQLAMRARDFRPEVRVLLLSGGDGDGRGFGAAAQAAFAVRSAPNNEGYDWALRLTGD